MITAVPSERVVVRRNGQVGYGVTTHHLHQNIHDKEGKIVGTGAFLAIGVREDSGHELYAQPNQLEPLGESDRSEIQDREEAAAEQIEALRGISYLQGLA